MNLPPVQPMNARRIQLSSAPADAVTQAAFQQTASDELGAQLMAAMKADQKVKRNEDAIAASKQRITGPGN